MSSLCRPLSNVYELHSVSDFLLRVGCVLSITLDLAPGDAREIYNTISNFEDAMV